MGGANPYRHPSTKKMVLNQALGGSMGGALNPADAPFELRIDWMRVHAWSDEPAYAMTVNGGTGIAANGDSVMMVFACVEDNNITGLCGRLWSPTRPQRRPAKASRYVSGGMSAV